MNRMIDIPSIPNLRDLGGLCSRNGKIIKSQMFYRSGKLSQVDEEGQQQMSALSLGCILDLRGEQEVMEQPDYVPKSCQYIHISGIPGHDPKKQNLNFMKLITDESTPEEIAYYHHFLVECYPMMPFGNQALRTFITYLLEQRKPILFHCSAGKDRTGFLAAILLLILDIPETVIMEDYLLSNRAFIQPLETFMKKRNLKDKAVAKLALDTIYVKEEYLQSALDAILHKYGNYEEYFLQELGLSEEKRQQLKDLYLY